MLRKSLILHLTDVSDCHVGGTLALHFTALVSVVME